MMDKATVIIPCFNVQEYILDCLDSVMLQGSVVHHTYVVDNNSTDDTFKKVRQWQKSNPNFPLSLLSETKPGAPAARNLPLNRVQTKWIQFLDADDLLLPGKIEEQIRQFPNAHVICAGFQRISLRGEKKYTLPNPNIPLALIQGAAGITSSNLFSTRSIQSVKGWDESLMSSQEYDLMFRLWQTGAAFQVDLTYKTLVRQRPHGQISQRNPAAKWIQLVRLRERMLLHFLTNPEFEDAVKGEMYQSFFDQIRNLAKYDLEEAYRSYSRRLKPISFFPKQSPTTTRAYLLCFRFLGFKSTERLKRSLRG